MEKNFTVTLGKQVAYSINEEKPANATKSVSLSLKYHSWLVGYVFYWLRLADWVTVGDKQLYVNHASLVSLASRVDQATKQWATKEGLPPTVTLAEFYKKVFETAKVAKPTALTDKITNLDLWIQNKIDASYTASQTLFTTTINEYKAFESSLNVKKTEAIDLCISNLPPTEKQFFQRMIESEFDREIDLKERTFQEVSDIKRRHQCLMFLSTKIEPLKDKLLAATAVLRSIESSIVEMNELRTPDLARDQQMIAFLLKLSEQVDPTALGPDELKWLEVVRNKNQMMLTAIWNFAKAPKKKTVKLLGSIGPKIDWGYNLDELSELKKQHAKDIQNALPDFAPDTASDATDEP